MVWHMLNPLDTLHQHNHGAQLDFIKYCTFISAKKDNNKEVFGGGKRKTKTFFFFPSEEIFERKNFKI